MNLGVFIDGFETLLQSFVVLAYFYMAESSVNVLPLSLSTMASRTIRSPSLKLQSSPIFLSQLHSYHILVFTLSAIVEGYCINLIDLIWIGLQSLAGYAMSQQWDFRGAKDRLVFV